MRFDDNLFATKKISKKGFWFIVKVRVIIKQ